MAEGTENCLKPKPPARLGTHPKRAPTAIAEASEARWHRRLEAVEARQRALQGRLETEVRLLEHLLGRLERQDRTLTGLATRLDSQTSASATPDESPASPELAGLPRGIPVSIRQVPTFAALSDLHAALSRLDGVRAVRVQNFRQGILNLTVEGPGPDELNHLLAHVLQPRILPDGEDAGRYFYRLA